MLDKLAVPGRPTSLDDSRARAYCACIRCALWETARYRLKYCLKGPLNPKQPTNQPIDFPNYVTIFTDGSKDGDTAGSACVTPSDTYKCRIPYTASIFSAEIKAIDLALDHIEQSRNTDFIIFSDSLSVPQSLHNPTFVLDHSSVLLFI